MMHYLHEKPTNVGTHELVIMAPTLDRYVHYVHKIDLQNSFEGIKWVGCCGEVAISDTYVWQAIHAVIIRSRWCGDCWRC